MLSKADGSYISQMQKIEKSQLLVLDDFGLCKLDTDSRLIFLEILEDRYGIASTVITSQLPVAYWHEIIGDSTIADAICDRLVNTSCRIELREIL
jgi:DNA replication protein DnaC